MRELLPWLRCGSGYKAPGSAAREALPRERDADFAEAQNILLQT